MATPELKLYTNLLSQPSRFVTLFCTLNSIPHTVQNVKLESGESKTPEFTKLNPNQMVPTLQDGDYSLFESTSILRYLHNRHPEKTAWMWPEEDRPKIEQFFSYYHTNLRRTALLFQMLYLWKGYPNYEMELKAREKEVMPIVEHHVNAMLPFLRSLSLSKPFTVCELVALCEIMNLNTGNYPLSEEVKQWVNGIERAIEPAQWKQIVDMHVVIRKMCAKRNWEFWLDKNPQPSQKL